MLNKDQSLRDVLARLVSDLGEGVFEVVDHWDGDLCAIGLARPADQRYLVYVCTFPPETELFAYECERPPTDPDFPYDSDGMVEEASYDQLLDAVRQHLAGGS